MARVSDNFEFLKTYGERPFQPYDGAWQLWERDIDPSLMIYNTYRTVGTDQTFCWWIPFEYDAWEKKSNLEWVKDSSDLPNFKSILQVTNPKDGSEWFVLQCFYNSQQPISAEKDEYDTPRRDIFFRIDSYLLEKSQTEKCYNWGMEQTYYEQRFPQGDHDSHSFIGEFYWGSSVQDVINIGEPFWTDESERNGKLPAKVYVSTYEYAFESDYDCSMKEGLHITFPNKLLIEKMKLINNLDGTFTDENDNIIAYDPSLFEKGPSAVLIKKKEFLEFLDNTGYNIIWQIIGQKMIMEGMVERSEWLGELDIHGMYYIQNKSVVGNQNNEFVNREILDNRRKEEASNQE